jgi:hypothetical protein
MVWSGIPGKGSGRLYFVQETMLASNEVFSLSTKLIIAIILIIPIIPIHHTSGE